MPEGCASQMNETFGFNDIVGGAGGGIHGLSIPVVVAMVALVFIIGLLSSRALRDRSLLVRHLFLKTNLRVQDRSQVSYIRSLDLTGGVLVMSSAPAKGTMVEIDLGSLPSFPDATAKVDAQVKSRDLM